MLFFGNVTRIEFQVSTYTEQVPFHPGHSHGQGRPTLEQKTGLPFCTVIGLFSECGINGKWQPTYSMQHARLVPSSPRTCEEFLAPAWTLLKCGCGS